MTSRNPSYAAAVATYERLAIAHGWLNPDGTALPISEKNLDLYFTYQIKCIMDDTPLRISVATVCKYLAAFKDYHNALNIPWASTYRTELIQHRLSVARAAAPLRPINQAQEITTTDLYNLLQVLNPGKYHNHLVCITASLVGFWGLARRNELLTDGAASHHDHVTRLSDIAVVPSPASQNAYSIRIRKPKIRTPHAQHLIVSPRTDSLCSVAFLERLLAWHTAQNHGPDTPLWHLDGQLATVAWFQGLWLAAVGIPIGVSSLRAGGATQLAFKGQPL
ncbi:hypothetical protein HDU86_001684 [Geranomyces michiganensis]|nr:hypothetical protein HDU86_001684 [Geranomyces michiganensis]